MAEYIKREAAIQQIADNFRQASADGCDNSFYHIAEETLAEIPAADVAPVVHGRWIKRPDERICPFCNDSHAYFGGADWNYCHNCGAKMDGE